MRLRGRLSVHLASKAPSASIFRLSDWLLQSLADQAAIAIENVRLYEHISQDLERRINELEVLSEIYGQISKLGIDPLMRFST